MYEHPPGRRSLPALVSVALALLACTADEGGEEPPLQGERREVLAPIEEAQLLAREPHPAGYSVRVVSGLPSGCAAFERIDVAHAPGRVELTVWNTMPADESLACTLIYRRTENLVDLGAAFEADGRYSIYINGESWITFSGR